MLQLTRFTHPRRVRPGTQQIETRDGITIHTPLRDITKNTQKLIVGMFNYNPYAPCGVWRNSGKIRFNCPSYYNSRTLASAALYLWVGLPDTLLQYTHSCGVRPKYQCCGKPNGNYNSHTRCGVWHWKLLYCKSSKTLQPTHSMRTPHCRHPWPLVPMETFRLP